MKQIHITNSLILTIFITINISLVKTATLNGQINIGNELNYYWSPNDNTPRQLELEILLSAESLTNAFQLTNPADITVTCQQKEEVDPSFIKVSFVSKRINNVGSSKTSVVVDFTILRAGRAGSVSCTVQTNRFVTQTINSVELTELKFAESLKSVLKISDYPTISFSPDQRTITNLDVSPFQDSFVELYLRDKVEKNPVNVDCSVVSTFNGLSLSANGASNIVKNLQLNSFSTLINYYFNNANLNLADEYKIECQAESVGTGADKQYKPTLAKATAIIKFIQPSIDLGISSNWKISGSSFKVPLKLKPNKPKEMKIYLECGLRTFYNNQDLITFQNSLRPTSCPREFPTPAVSSATSSLTYENTPVDFVFLDSLNSTNEYEFADENKLNYINIEQRPISSFKKDTNVFLVLFCCDSTNLPRPLASTTTTRRANVARQTRGPLQFRYSNIVSRILLTMPANLDPNFKYDNPTTDVSLLDPNYDPCTCDLTVDQCDFGCCCDTKCTTADFELSGIQCPKRHRRIYEKIIDKWTCNDIYNQPKFSEPDWFPIICIHFNTSVLLGNFYSPKLLNALVGDKEKFQSKLKSAFDASYNTRSKYLNEPIGVVQGFVSCSLESNNPYQQGSCIKTARLLADDYANDFFRFPQQAHSTSCVYNSPVKFLTSKGRLFCNIKVDQTICNDPSSYLNYANFNKKILFANPTTNDKVGITDVEYYKCDKFPYGSIETPSSSSQFDCQSDPNDPTKRCQFASTTKLFDFKADDVCQANEWKYSSVRINDIKQKVKADYYLRPNTYQTQPITNAPYCTKLSPSGINPTASNANGDCLNAVAGVKYVIFWNGNSIKRVLARIILTDVPNTNAQLKQMFELVWTYLPEPPNDVLNLNSIITTDAYDDLFSGEDSASEPYLSRQKSGNKGYVIGKPLVSGYYEQTSNRIDITNTQRISSYKTLNGKLCGTLSTLERSLIRFGQNSSSNCVVRVTKDDINKNCLCLRRIMFKKLNDYFAPSNFVSKNGNPNILNGNFDETDWLKVYPEKRIMDVSKDNPNEQLFDQCSNVPSKILISIFHVFSGRSNSESINEIIGVYVNYTYSNWTFNCKSDKQSCLSPDYTNDYSIGFELNFINNTNKNYTWLERCKFDQKPSPSCLEEVFWTWPKDYNDPQFFYLYSVHLGLIFGAFSLLIAYFMVFGFSCLC